LAPRQERVYHGIHFLLVAHLCWPVGLPGLWSLAPCFIFSPFLGCFLSMKFGKVSSIPSHLGGQFATLVANVSAFNNILTSML
jgi:hypothetical protein